MQELSTNSMSSIITTGAFLYLIRKNDKIIADETIQKKDHHERCI